MATCMYTILYNGNTDDNEIKFIVSIPKDVECCMNIKTPPLMVYIYSMRTEWTNLMEAL